MRNEDIDMTLHRLVTNIRYPGYDRFAWSLIFLS